MTEPVARATLGAIRQAQSRLEPIVIRSPLVPCHAGDSQRHVFLKLENLQAIGSFKVRPIGNAVLSRPHTALERGVLTSSSGNSGVAVAWMARRLGIGASVVVPENAPAAKLERLRELGARIVEVSPQEWWRAVGNRGHPGVEGLYIDAVRDPEAIAGDGTLGVEILEQLPDVEAILVPFGGGALACGIASAMRELRSDVKVIACELDSAQPLTAAMRAGRVVSTACRPGFVSGVGFESVLPEMWPLAAELIDSTVTVSIGQVAAAIKLLAERNHVIAEGAGALPVAAALWGELPCRRVCAVVSGGNLGSDLLASILFGRIPD